MKNYLILFILLFGIFVIPNNVFAEEKALHIPYYNKLEDFDLNSGEGETLKNILYENSSVEKEEGDKCILIYKEEYNCLYHLICSPNLDNVKISYYTASNSFGFFFNDIKYYRFNENYELKFDTSGYNFNSSSNSFENVFMYSDIPIKFTTTNGFEKVLFYDLNNSSKVYGEFLLDNTTLYNYKDFYLTEPNEDIVIFQDNDFHSISKLILGDNIPEEYSFVYTISDYLLVILLVIIVISPIAIIIKVMRW